MFLCSVESEEFILFRLFSLSGCVAVNEERRSRGFLVVSTHTIFIIFIIFIKLVPKFSRTTRGKIFKNRHTHTHTDIVVEKEKEKPRTRDDDNERGKR